MQKWLKRAKVLTQIKFRISLDLARLIMSQYESEGCARLCIELSGLWSRFMTQYDSL